MAKTATGIYFGIDVVTGVVSKGAQFGSLAPIAHVIAPVLVAMRTDKAGNIQGQIAVTVEDVAAEAIILAQGPSVLPNINTGALMKPTKVLRSRAGDVIALTNSGSLVEDYYACGDQSGFGVAGDAVLSDIQL